MLSGMERQRTSEREKAREFACACVRIGIFRQSTNRPFERERERQECFVRSAADDEASSSSTSSPSADAAPFMQAID